MAARPRREAFERFLNAERLTLRQFERLSGIHYSRLARLGRDLMPTSAQQFQIALVTRGRVMPNDWYADLPPSVETIELSENDLVRLGRGERVVVNGKNGRRVEIVVSRAT